MKNTTSIISLHWKNAIANAKNGAENEKEEKSVYVEKQNPEKYNKRKLKTKT